MTLALIEKLERALQMAPLPIQYWHQHARLGADAAEVRALRASLRAAPARRAAEADQRPEGHWGTIPDPETHALGIDIPRLFNTLRLLVDHGATLEDEPVLRALEAIWRCQMLDGRFPLFWHQMGDLLATLGRLGLAQESRTQRLRAILLHEQRPDGGWLNPAFEPYAYATGGPSCVWTTVNVARGLLATTAATPRETALSRAATFLEETVLTPGYRSFNAGGMEPWQTLHYNWRGVRFFVGPHLVLETLTNLGGLPTDPAISRLWAHIEPLRGRDGWWGDGWTTLSLWRSATALHTVGA